MCFIIILVKNNGYTTTELPNQFLLRDAIQETGFYILTYVFI